MTQRRCWIGVLCAAAVLSACSEPTRPEVDSESSIVSREPTESELANMPAEFRFPTYIYRHDITGSFQPGFALAQSILGYFASHASVTLTLDLFNGDTKVGPPVVGVERRGDLIPWQRELSAMVTAGVMSECGYRLNTTSQAEIHNQFPTAPAGFMIWMAKGNGQTTQAAQPFCPCAGGGGYGGENWEMATTLFPTGATFQCYDPHGAYGGGGGGSGGGSAGSWATVTTTTCYGTHYYNGEGKYLHSHIHYCEQSTSSVWVPAAA